MWMYSDTGHNYLVTIHNSHKTLRSQRKPIGMNISSILNHYFNNSNLSLSLSLEPPSSHEGLFLG